MADPDRTLRPVDLPSAGITLSVPAGWQQVPGDGDVVFAARQPDAPWFRVNLTVALDHSGPATDVREAGALVADALPGGRLVEARDHPDEGWELVVVHRAPAQDVVTTQRQLHVERRSERGVERRSERGVERRSERGGDDHTVAVSVTWAVEQETAWRGEVAAILDTVARR